MVLKDLLTRRATRKPQKEAEAQAQKKLTTTELAEQKAKEKATRASLGIL